MECLTEFPSTVQQVIDGAEKLKLGMKLQIVESNYYSMSLEERALILNANSIDELCKTLLFENKKWKKDNHKYILVCVQYTDKISTKKMNQCFKDLEGCSANFRIAPEDKAEELTGFRKGGVTAIGCKSDILIVISERISLLDQFFLGAGHLDWKLSVSPGEFQEKSGCLIWNISEN